MLFLSAMQKGVPHHAGQLKSALEGLHTHVQQQLQGLGGQDTRMAELLRQLGEQEAEQQVCGDRVCGLLCTVFREEKGKSRCVGVSCSPLCTFWVCTWGGELFV